MVENFVECYHCAPSHPEFSSMHPPQALIAFGAGPSSGPAEAVEQYLPALKAWEARAAALGRPIGTIDDGPDSSHLRLLLQRTIREGYESETQDGRPAAPLMGKRTAFDQGRMYLSFSPFTQLVATNDFAVLFLFTPRSTTKTDVDLYWLVDGKAREVDVTKMIWGWDQHHASGQGDHGEQPGGYRVNALPAGTLLRARAARRDVPAMVSWAVRIYRGLAAAARLIVQLANRGLMRPCSSCA